jgi:hypothetical protein
MIIRRLGISPSLRESHCSGCNNCPDVFELEDGDFAVIGQDETEGLRPLLPSDAGCGAGERIVRVPRAVLIGACRDLPGV